MPNPNPKTSHLDATRYRPIGDRPLGKVIGTRYPADVDTVLRGMGDDKQAFIRNAVELAISDPTIRVQVEKLAEHEGGK